MACYGSRMAILAGGMLLGVANALAISMLMVLGTPAADATSFIVLAAAGCIPGCLAGAMLGALASLIQRRSPLCRTAVLIVAALAVVVAIFAPFTGRDGIVLASVPTVIAAIALERWSRRVPLPPPIPVATARTLSR